MTGNEGEETKALRRGAFLSHLRKSRADFSRRTVSCDQSQISTALDWEKLGVAIKAVNIKINKNSTWIAAFALVLAHEAAFVVAEGHVEDPMEVVLDGQMIADEGAEQAGDESQRGNVDSAVQSRCHSLIHPIGLSLLREMAFKQIMNMPWSVRDRNALRNPPRPIRPATILPRLGWKAATAAPDAAADRSDLAFQRSGRKHWEKRMPASHLQTLRAMAYNNAWANHRLLSACAKLTQMELDAKRTSFFPSIQATLNHILIVDWFYVDSLEGGSLGPAAWADEMPCPILSALQREQAAVDRRLIACCDGLDEPGLDRIVQIHRGDRVQQERTDRLLLHIFQHQIHHRGQAHAMLSDTSVRPPQLDEFFSIGEAPLRAAEFAELGFTEQAIWRDG